jgi:hypothetical protein
MAPFVLQVSAPFDHGQSGGHSSITRVTWLESPLSKPCPRRLSFALAFDGPNEEVLTRRQPPGASHKTAFWERARDAQPLFLRAASLEADRDWQALLGVAQQWTASDATNSASWLALWRAFSSLKRDKDADLALVRAVALIHR